MAILAMIGRLLPVLRRCQQSCSSVTSPLDVAACFVPRVISDRVPFCTSSVLAKKKKERENPVESDEFDEDESESESKRQSVSDGLPKDYKELKVKLANKKLENIVKRVAGKAAP